jgi:hypothetical protein
VRLVIGLCLGGLFALAGCGPRLVEVSGKATVGGKPLTKAGVFFAPDKDNPSKEIARGWPDENGVYHVQTGGSKGCPTGWYKVFVIVETKRGSSAPSPVHAKYLDPAKSPLSIEVVANPKPGAYDFNFQK